MFKSLLVGALLLIAPALQAQQLQSVVALASNTVSNLLSGAYIIDNFIAINATTNNVTIRFYDTSNTTTTMVQAAYTSYASYATNYSITFTNEAGVLVTNTFAGIYTAPTTNSAATNSKPVIQSIIVPAGTTLNKDVRLQVVKGLAAIPVGSAVTLLTTYRLP